MLYQSRFRITEALMITGPLCKAARTLTKVSRARVAATSHVDEAIMIACIDDQPKKAVQGRTGGIGQDAGQGLSHP
jgi:hypothetical protein